MCMGSLLAQKMANYMIDYLFRLFYFGWNLIKPLKAKGVTVDFE